jgi:hypothetical protein
MFSHISMSWRGRPLTSHDVIVNTIAATTTTRTGLQVRAELDTGSYPNGIKITDRKLETLEKQRHTAAPRLARIRRLARRGHGDYRVTILEDDRVLLIGRIQHRAHLYHQRPSPTLSRLSRSDVAASKPIAEPNVRAACIT